MNGLCPLIKQITMPQDLKTVEEVHKLACLEKKDTIRNCSSSSCCNRYVSDILSTKTWRSDGTECITLSGNEKETNYLKIGLIGGTKDTSSINSSRTKGSSHDSPSSNSSSQDRGQTLTSEEGVEVCHFILQKIDQHTIRSVVIVKNLIISKSNVANGREIGGLKQMGTRA